MTSLALDLARGVLTWLFLSYTIVAVGHYLLQVVFAHRTYRRQRSAAFAESYPDLTASVDIIVPCYNEEPALLDACVRSALGQDHLGEVRVIVVDDGSPNRSELEPTYRALERAGALIIRSPRNIGKRHAQALALPRCQGEIVVTLDSDSVLAPDAVRRLTRQFKDPKVGAATGFVDVENTTANLLTRIQRVRYWMAFNQERAAQTYFRTVMCCSGPLAAYRLDVLRSITDAYLSQRYGGVDCTYGDDRHLTNLVLAAGYDTVFDQGAVAYTHVPERLRQFLRQQLRWNKSFYRELVWTMPFISRRPWYSRFDVACQVAMPMMLTVTAGSALVVGTLGSPLYLLRYLAFIALAATLRATYAAIRERDPRFYFFILYGFMSSFLLMSVRLVALSTLTDARWGTRGPEPTPGGGWFRLQSANLVPAFQGGEVEVRSDGGGMHHPIPPTQAPFDSAWRAGLRTGCMMARPMTPAELVFRGSALAGQDPPGPGAQDEPTVCSGCAYRWSRAARYCRRCGTALGVRAG